MKNLSNNEAELKRRCLKNKKSRVSAYDSFCIRRVINICINTYTNTLHVRNTLQIHCRTFKNAVWELVSLFQVAQKFQKCVILFWDRLFPRNVFICEYSLKCSDWFVFYYVTNSKVSKVMTYHDRFPSIKPHDTLITWFCKVTWQTKNISPLP